MPSHAIRAFFGLPLPDAHRNALESYIASCAAAAPAFRWTPTANLHLTVRFLGQVEVSVAEGIADRVVASGLHRFDLRLGDHAGSFKRGRLSRVVWLGLREGEEPIGALARVVEAETVAAGLEPEGRRFHAHLTLARARAREGAPLPPLPRAPELPSWHANELILYRSHLGRAGSVYEPLRAVTLG